MGFFIYIFIVIFFGFEFVKFKGILIFVMVVVGGCWFMSLLLVLIVEKNFVK